MCPPVLVKVLYALWADTQVRPYSGLHEPLANSQEPKAKGQQLIPRTGSR